MHIKALRPLFVRETGQYVAEGESLEVDEAKGKLLVGLKVAEQITATEAKKLVPVVGDEEVS